MLTLSDRNAKPKVFCVCGRVNTAREWAVKSRGHPLACLAAGFYGSQVRNNAAVTSE